MSQIRKSCPSCNSPFMLPPGVTSGAFRCPGCGKVLQVGKASSSHPGQQPAAQPTGGQQLPIQQPQFQQPQPQPQRPSFRHPQYQQPQYQQPTYQQPQYQQPQYQQPQYQQPQYQQPQSFPTNQPGFAPGNYPAAGSYGAVGKPYAAQPSAGQKSHLPLILGLSLGGLFLIGIVSAGVIFAVARGSSKADPSVATSNQPESGNNSQSSSSSVTNTVTGANNFTLFGPTIDYDQQPVYESRNTGMRYLLNSNQRFAVDFEYATDFPGSNQNSVLAGRVTYQVTNRNPDSVMSDAADLVSMGTGTGFVVRPDGYMVTCAHVVVGAVQIEVHLNGRMYAGKVVALDTKNDLAIVRIRANDLPHLTVFNSDQVRLAEDVRAFGFPLTDQLGESLKITRGTLSGISEKAGSKVFQLDVTVTPGNSGGPLTNEKGQVVGVNSALLSGEGIAEVSFAVTANDMRRLMERCNLKYEPANASATVMSGPDLAEKVQRSVALLKVKTGPGGVGIAEKKVLQYTASFTRYKQIAGSSNRLDESQLFSESGVMLIDSTGEVSYCDGSEELPYQLGLVATVGVQPLADDEADSWRSARIALVTERQSIQIPGGGPGDTRSTRYESFSDSLARRYDPYSRRRPPTRSVSTVKLHPAIEMAKYEIVNRAGDAVDIKKTMEFFTISRDDQDPYMRVSGGGMLKFDKTKGQPLSMNFAAKVIYNENGSSVEIPVKLKYAAVNDQQMSRDQAIAQKVAEEQKAQAQKAQEQEAAQKAARQIPIVKRLDQLDLGK